MQFELVEKSQLYLYWFWLSFCLTAVTARGV